MTKLPKMSAEERRQKENDELNYKKEYRAMVAAVIITVIMGIAIVFMMLALTKVALSWD